MWAGEGCQIMEGAVSPAEEWDLVQEEAGTRGKILSRELILTDALARQQGSGKQKVRRFPVTHLWAPSK